MDGLGMLLLLRDAETEEASERLGWGRRDGRRERGRRGREGGKGGREGGKGVGRKGSELRVGERGELLEAKWVFEG